MCGLLGMMGPGVQHTDLDMFKQLAFVSFLRGEHSSGIAQGRTDIFNKSVRNNYVVDKLAVTMPYFIWFHTKHKEGNKRLFNSVHDNFFMAHTRAATKGNITNDNAHPFEFDNIIGMHNGTLVDKKYQHPTKTDSELLLEDINERGVIPVLKELDPVSAYALVIFDKNTGRFTFTRNIQRKLYACFCRNRSVMYWASEDSMLEFIFKRNDESMLLPQDKESSLVYFKPHHVYTTCPSDIKAGDNAVWTIDEFTPDKTFSIAPNNRRYMDWQDWAEYQHEESVDKSRLPWKTEEEIAQEKVLLLENKDNKRKSNSTPGWYKNLKEKQDKGKILEFDPAKMIGHVKEDAKIPHFLCVDCAKEMSLLDQYYGVQISDNVFVCENCENKPDTKEVKVG